MDFTVKDHANAKAFVVSVQNEEFKTTAATFYYEYGINKDIVEMQALSFATCMNNINNCTLIKLIG